MRVVWVNKKSALEGGCERAIEATLRLLAKNYEIESILLYELGSAVEPSFTRNFDGAFPVVDLEAQLRQLDPDTVFIHRAEDSWLDSLSRMTQLRRVAFVHDHDMLCLRRHKLTVRGRRPCTRSSGLSCTLRCGPVQRGARGLELRSPIALRRGQQALSKMDAVVAPSVYVMELLESVGVSSERLHRLAPFAKLPEPRDGSRIVPSRLVYVGALTRGKGVGQLLQSLAFLNANVELELLGDGPQRNSLQDKVARLGLSDRVHFHGNVDQDRVFEQLETAALLVMPSIAPETFGLAGAEALAAEVPVVGTRAGGVTDWLCDGVTGTMVEAGDPKALAAAISSNLESPMRSKQRALRGRQRILELINEEAHVRRLGLLLGLTSVAAREVA
jgi:glycosyltransferase involved in cell wall biosynthesis